jgi:hypothetical protein
LAFTLLFVQVSAQQKMALETKQVTVFASTAQLDHTTQLTLKKGEQTVVFTGLSPRINASTIRVRPANRQALVRKITYKTEYTEGDADQAKIDALYSKLEAEKRNMEVISAKKTGLLKERDFINQNMNVNGSTGMKMTLAQFQQTQSYFRKKMESIQTELYDLELKRKDQLAVLNKLVLELKKANSRKTELNGMIEVLIDAEKATTTTFSIDYLVNNAGWTPEYELRVDEVGKPAYLELKAKLVQATEVDWKNVDLVFSTGDPNRSSEAPVLYPWYITQPVAKPAVYNKQAIVPTAQGYSGRFFGTVWDASTNESLPFANVVFYGTDGQIVGGVATDFDGTYSFVSNDLVKRIEFSFIGYQTQSQNAPANGQMNIRLNQETSHLDEVVIVSSRSYEDREVSYTSQSMSVDGVQIKNMPMREVRRAEKQRTAKITNYNAQQVRKAITQRYEAKTPYTVKSDGQEMAISLQEFELPVDYEYLAIPKLDEDAFLEALLFGWDTLGLISGNIKVFIEGSFVGNSSLDANSLEDTLSFSLGRDPAVVVQRTDVPDQYRKIVFWRQADTNHCLPH